MQNHLQAMKVRELTPTEQPNELAHKQNPLREMALFAGAGGGILGGHLLGWECVCAVEWEPYPQAYLSPDRMKAFSRLSRFGMTCEPLMDTLGADVLTWYLEGFPVRTYPQPEKERGSKASDLECGKKWHGSLAKYDPDTCSWRTAQYSLLGGLGLFLETWPRWGTMRNGECSALEIAVASICENVSSFSLPTIGKNEFKGSSRARFLGSMDFRGAKMSEGLRTCEDDHQYTHPDFAEEVMGFPSMWTELAQLGMRKFQQWCVSHGLPSTNASNAA